MVLVRSPSWDTDRFMQDFETSHCYWPPLKLEDGTEDTFLETRFVIENNQATYRLKNDNETEYRIWRYHDFDSYGGYTEKRATLFNCLRKVASYSSNDAQLLFSGAAKLKEFEHLHYPAGIRRFACTILGAGWFLLKSGVFFPQTYSPYSDLFARYSHRLAYSQGELIPNAIHFYSSFYSCYSLVAE